METTEYLGERKPVSDKDECGNIMTHEQMLRVLEDVPYVLIWPGNWDDVGFTEREIWVNSKGYGYIMCDEPTQCWEGPGLGAEKWVTVKQKILNGSLTYDDIKNTSIEDLLDAIYLGYGSFDDQDQLCADLTGLAATDYPMHYFYALETIEETRYFKSKEEFWNAYERDWADEYWDDMDDVLLAEWIRRLRVEEDPLLVEWVRRNSV